MTLGTLAFTQVSDSTPYALLTAALVVRGMGLGASMMPSTAAAYATLDRDSVPRATSAINAVQRIGGSIGVALLSVVLEHQVGGVSGGVGARSQPSAEVAAAFSTTFWWAVVLAALAFVPALLLPRRPAPAPRPEAPRPPEPAAAPREPAAASVDT